MRAASWRASSKATAPTIQKAVAHSPSLERFSVMRGSSWILRGGGDVGIRREVDATGGQGQSRECSPRRLTLLGDKVATEKQKSKRPTPWDWPKCLNIGGEGGIRTHGKLAPTPDFESGTFDHSATSPGYCELRGREAARSVAQGSRRRKASARFLRVRRRGARRRPSTGAALPARRPNRRPAGSSPEWPPACGRPQGRSRSACAGFRSCPVRS